MSIEPIKRVSVSDEVFLQMKELLLNHEWRPGGKIPSENDLCGLFHVSRVTVRNALHRLGALGLLETRLGDGTYVRDMEGGENFYNLIPIAYFEEDVVKILEFRREIESGTAALAAEKATGEDIIQLRLLLAEMDGLQEDLGALAGADLKFHYKISQITQNPLIIKTYAIISDIYTSHMRRMVGSMGGQDGVFYHKKIVEAVEAHDTCRARAYMLEHISKNLEFIASDQREERGKQRIHTGRSAD